jgi:hypothetical protein
MRSGVWPTPPPVTGIECEIVEAHRVMEAGEAGGKMVVATSSETRR